MQVLCQHGLVINQLGIVREALVGFAEYLKSLAPVVHLSQELSFSLVLAQGVAGFALRDPSNGSPALV